MEDRFKQENNIGFPFSLSLNDFLEIRSSQPIEEDVSVDEIRENITYRIFLNEKSLPFELSTQLEAIMICFGCQCVVMELFKNGYNGGKND